MAAAGFCCCCSRSGGWTPAATTFQPPRGHNSISGSSAVDNRLRNAGNRGIRRDCGESSPICCHQRRHDNGECPSPSAGAGPDLSRRTSGWQPQETAFCSAWRSGSSSLFGESGHGRSPWKPAASLPSRSRESAAHSERSVRCSASAQSRDEAVTLKAIEDLSERLLSLKGAVNNEYRAIGPEMRGRVDRLYDRVDVLRQSADRAIKTGNRIPAQLTTNLIGLQREHGSLENIVRLTMEAAPDLEALEAKISKPANVGVPASSVLVEEKPQLTIFETLIRESSLDTKPKTPKYVMSSPASKGPLAAFRDEIERRVVEQLAKKRKSELAPASVTESSQTRSSTAQTEVQELDKAPAELQLVRERSPEEGLASSSESQRAGETRSTDTSLEDKLKQLELDLAKSIPLHVFEQKVSKISTSLSDARAQVTQLTAEVREKEAMLAIVKQEMMAEKDQLLEKVTELTGDLEKMYSTDDLEAAVNFGLQEVEKELEEEQDRTFLLARELEKKENFFAEQQEKWRIEKEEMETQLKAEQDRSTSLALELEEKNILVTEQEEKWREEKLGLEADLKSVQVKLQDIRKKRTKERAQLAEKKQKAKTLELELKRAHDTMEEADKVRLQKKEATYATVRMLIGRMVQASRERAESDAQANSLSKEIVRLQDENRTLEFDRKATEDKAGMAESTIRSIKSSLISARAEVPAGQGESSVEGKAAALEKFFSIMGEMIKQEAANVDELSPDFVGSSESELVEGTIDLSSNGNSPR